jgi:hypothetical protein
VTCTWQQCGLFPTIEQLAKFAALFPASAGGTGSKGIKLSTLLVRGWL